MEYSDYDVYIHDRDCGAFLFIFHRYRALLLRVLINAFQYYWYGEAILCSSCIFTPPKTSWCGHFYKRPLLVIWHCRHIVVTLGHDGAYIDESLCIRVLPNQKPIYVKVDSFFIPLFVEVIKLPEIRCSSRNQHVFFFSQKRENYKYLSLLRCSTGIARFFFSMQSLCLW